MTDASIDLAAMLPDRLPLVRRTLGRARRYSYATEDAPPYVRIVVHGRTADITAIDEGQLTNTRLAAYLLRFVAADLATAGIDNVAAPKSAGADVVLRLKSAGFANGAGNHLRRATPRFPHVLRSALRYVGLKGTNRVAEQIALAEVIVQRIRRIRGVHAVLALGSIARGFADSYSDVDLFVVGQGGSLRSIPAGEQWAAGHDFDIFVVDLTQQPYESWDTSRRQAVSEGVILFQRDEESIRRVRSCVALLRQEQRFRISEALLQLGWIGFHPRSLDGQTRFGYRWVGAPDSWMSRGHIPSAHHAVDYALGWMVELLFLTNGHLPPDPKWRRFVVRSLPWLPERFDRRLTAVERGSRDESGFLVRCNGALSLIEDVFVRLVQRRLIPADVYRTYLMASDVYTSEREPGSNHAPP